MAVAKPLMSEVAGAWQASIAIIGCLELCKEAEIPYKDCYGALH